MALVFKNPLMESIRGMLGGMLVFRRVGNQTIVSAAPGKGYPRSEQQLAQQGRFKEAMAYAKAQAQR